jgi:hypothetical protein
VPRQISLYSDVRVKRPGFDSPQHQDRLWSPPRLVSDWYRWQKGWDVKLITHLDLLLKSIMVELYLHSPYDFTAWFLVFFYSFWGWGGTKCNNWPIVPAPDDDECGAVSGMRIGKGNRSTRRKPSSVTLCPPQIPHDLTWAWTRATAVGSRRLTAWAMSRPS